MENNVLFRFKCTKSIDDRFTIGRIYTMYYTAYNTCYYHYVAFPEDNVDLTSNEYNDISDKRKIYEAWYKACNWTDYDFEYIDNYIVDLL